MTDKEIRRMKDGVIRIFEKFNILDHAATIGSLRDDILRLIGSMQERPGLKFNVGDKVRNDKIAGLPICTIESIDDTTYYCDYTNFDIIVQDKWELVVEPKDCMYSKDNYTDEDRKVLCEGCEEECEFNKKEEPVRIKKGCKYRCLSDMQNIDTGAIGFFKDKIYSAPEDNTLVSEENGWLCDTSENSSNFELVEEPVSEDLEEAGKEWLRPQLDKSYANYGEAKMMELTHFDGYAMLDAIEFGAQWKEQQMMKDAVDGCCISNGKEVGSAIKSPIGMVFLKYNKFNVGDKVKLIVVKEED